MGTKWASKALLEVIPPRICVTFCRGSFWYRPENSNMRFSDDKSQNTINNGSGSHDNFLKSREFHKNDRNWTHIRRIGLRIKRFESPRCYQSNRTPPVPPKQPCTMQNRLKIHWTQPTRLSTKFGHQPEHYLLTIPVVGYIR